MALTVVKAAPSSTAFLVLGARRDASPLPFGCALNVEPLAPVVVGPLPVSTVGSVRVPTLLPPGVPAGDVAVQALVDTGAGTLQATNGVLLTFVP